MSSQIKYTLTYFARQYSSNEHRVIRGIGLISCIYANTETGYYSVIDYRI